MTHRASDRFFAPAGVALHQFIQASDFDVESPAAETCREADRRLHKMQYLWDGIRAQKEVIVPEEPDTSNLMVAMAAFVAPMTQGPDLRLELEIAIEATFYNAWRIRQALRDIDGINFECTKVSFVRNQLLEHPDYSMIYASTGLGLTSNAPPHLGAKARQEATNRFEGYSLDECMEEFRGHLQVACEAATEHLANTQR